MNITFKDFPADFVTTEEIKKAFWNFEQREWKQPLKALTVRFVSDTEYGFTPEFEVVPFQRIRRITGYLVPDTSRWNAAKFSELRDRRKHS